MSSGSDAVTGEAVKRAIEGRDGAQLASFYADAATLRIIDRMNPPSKPRELKGKEAIAEYWNDVCSRDMTHTVETTVTAGDRLAFTEACAYPGGAKVFCQAMLELQDGRIVRQTIVQAWDE